MSLKWSFIYVRFTTGWGSPRKHKNGSCDPVIDVGGRFIEETAVRSVNLVILAECQGSNWWKWFVYGVPDWRRLKKKADQGRNDTMANNNKESTQPNTQTGTQSGLWSQIESQPVDSIVYGRLYAKNLKIKSLGTKKALPLIPRNASCSYGTWLKLQVLRIYFDYRHAPCSKL